MDNLFDTAARKPAGAVPLPRAPQRVRTYRCQCGRSVFFRNTECLACESALGYEPRVGEVRAMIPADEPGTYRLAGDGDTSAKLYRRCINFDSPAVCNWLVAHDDTDPSCVACRLNRWIPDLDDVDNRRYWRAIEIAKRRLVAELLALGLPVESKREDPQRGLAFDFLRSEPDGPFVITGHACGVITLDVEEADDQTRERVRRDLREPYRTLLGHFRHEIGHYYWDRLIEGTHWHEPFRALFGDERTDYAAALESSYEHSPPEDWEDRHISAYAATHPWEDWAETFAHFLHLHDALDTAIGLGFTGKALTMEFEHYTAEDLYAPDDPDGPRMLTLINSWLALTMVLNELARSMGQPDFYPFVMSRPIVRKLHFIQLVAREAGAARQMNDG